MPDRRPRRLTGLVRAAAAATIVVVAGALGAPATVASGAAPERTVRCPKGTEGAVTDAYANVFSRAQELTADQRAASLAGGDDPATRALLQAWLADPDGASSTVTFTTVECKTRTRAVVDATLVLNGTPLPDVLPPGKAVRERGVWKVATATFCFRMLLEDPTRGDSGPCERS